MATLIQSKQIEGIVTASVVTGEFLISGSLVVTGSQSLLGSVTASAITSSFSGDGSGITGITYSQIDNTPQFVGGNNITITSSSNVITVHAQLDGTGSDAQSLSISGDQLTILGGNTITIPTGSTSWEQLSNIPSGLISSSVQILGGSGVLSGSKTNISSLNTFSSSIQSEVDSLTASTSSYLTSSGSVDFSDVTNKPTLVSSSDQITITESQISDLTHYTNTDVRTYIDSIGVVSGSYVESLPQGVISGSEQLPQGLISQSDQITITESQISDLSHTDISNLNTFTSSIQLEVDSLTSATSSYLTEVPAGTVSGSQQIIDSLPSGVVSGSSQINISSSQITDLAHTQIPAGTISGSEQLPQGLISQSDQITITESQVSDLTHYTDSDVQSYIDSIGIVSGSVVAELPSGVISGSTQLPSGLISGSTQLPSGLISGSTQVVNSLPSGTVSGSGQITITESQISDLSHTDISNLNTFTSSIQSEVDSLTASTSSYLTSIDSGIVSSSVQVTELLPSGVVSGSSQISITESQISDLTHYTDSDVKTKLDIEGVVSGSVIREIPQGTISGSSQITNGSTLLSGSFVEKLPSGTVSGSAQVLGGTDIISGSSQLPSGLVSGSQQILGGSAILSGSFVEKLPSGTLSGSVQVLGGTDIISGSSQLSGSTIQSTVSGSFFGNVRATNGIVSGSDQLSESLLRVELWSTQSASIDARMDALAGMANHYDTSNTVWNQRYIKSGSDEASLTGDFQVSGRVPFTFRLNQDSKLNYTLGDIVYITNFDRDTIIRAQVSSQYNTGSREVQFSTINVNGDTGSIRINDSYWIITDYTNGFITSASYEQTSASLDRRIDVIVASGSGADWNVNLTNIPANIIQIVSASFDLTSQFTGSSWGPALATTQSLTLTSQSINTTIDNVFSSASSDSFLFGGKDIVSSSQQVIDFLPSGVISGSTQITNIIGQEYPTLVTGSSQIDHGSITGVVGDEHIDHTSVLINAGDGLDGGGDISETRTITLNVTSSHFTSGVGDVLTSEGVVKQSTLDTDIVGTDFSQSVDTRINAIVASSIPAGTVSGSTQVDITQTENYTAFSSSIATSIAGVSGGASTDISHLNTFSSSIQSTVDSLVDVTASYATTGSNTFIGDQSILGSLIPGAGGIHNLGSADNPYGELFLTTGSVYLGNNKLSIDSDNDFKIESDGSLANLIANHIHFGNDKKKLSLNSDNKLQFTDNSNSVNYGFDLGANSLSDLIDVSSTSPTDGQSLVWDADNSTWIPNTVVAGSEIPQGTISSSQQISDLGFVTSSGAEGEHTDITLLNTFSGSIQSQVDTLIASTASYLTSETDNQTLTIVGDQLTISDGNTITIPTGSNVTLPSGIVSGSSQLTSSYDTRYLTSSSYFVDSASFDTRIDGIAAGNVPSGTVSSSAQITYDGNRIISNDKLGDLFTDSVNPGTSGSVIDFLNAIFYPNTGPSISTGNQTIIEYVTSGTTITTVSGTDPEGQSITFGTSSLYTDDLVRVASNGVMTLNALAESSSFNTDLVGGVHGHKVEVTATDSFGTTTEKDIYVIITPNSTPVFRETSTSGNVITSVTANLNESSTDDTLVKRVYFTDSNGDNITIYSSSIDNNHFDVTKYSTYVDIRQNTSSLDYEQQTSYTFSISASDEHYEAGQDSDSIVGLPITINVTDNLTPTVNNQTLSSINENSSNGATVGSISAADNEGNTITFVNFELHQLQLDGSIVSSGSYSGTSQLTDPHENPFQMSTSGIVTRKTGVYLNSDLVNRYVYRAQVTDPYNGTSSPATITIPITDDTAATLYPNWPAGPYIIESAVTGNTIRRNTDGRTGITADYNSSQSGTWSSSNSVVSINSGGQLLLGSDVSGNYVSGNTITSTITFTNAFGTITTDTLNISVAANSAPTATFSNTSFNNTNQATGSANMISVTISDTEGDTPYGLTLSGTNASSLNAVPQNSDSSSWELQVASDLSAGTYTYDVTVTDNFGKSTSYNGRTLTIAQGDTGTLGGDTTSYIIESAESGDVLRDATGYNQGNASQLSVSYTNYGSPSVQEYTSSNEAFNIDTSGNITLGLDLSGSVTQSGETITSDITFVDQYGNIGSGSLSVSVFANNPVSATFTENSSFFNTNQATGSTSLVDITSISDTESNTPYVVTLTGAHASSFNVVSQNVNGTSWELQPSSDLLAGDYDYNVVITDNYSEVTTYSRSLTISQADNGTLGGDTTSYIIESGENGDAFRDASGFGAGNTSQLSVSYSPNYGSSVVQSFTSSNDSVTIDGSGYITFNGDLSGTGSGDTITSDITFDDQYGNVGSGSVTVNVFANGAPTADFSNSGLTGNYNENLATSGTALLTSTLTDTEGDTPYSMSLSGTSAWAIQAVPQNSDSSSYQIQVTDDTSSLAAGTYTYDVEVTDSFGKSTTYSNRTFTIAAADDGTLVSTDTYIIESAVSGDSIRRNSNGRSGTQSSVAVSYSPSYGSPVATNFASSNALIDIDSNGRLSVGNDISGSGNTNGSIIATTITWNDQYSNNGSQVISIDVTQNFAPTVSSTSTSNLNTNQATGSELILRLNLTDTEGDTINASGLTWTGYDSTYFTPSNTTGQMNLLVNNTSVPAGEYDYTASMEDVHGFSTNLVSGSYTIAQADNGTLGGDTAIYSIESAESGDSYRDATGYNNGNTAQVSVSYSPSYGSPSVQSFTSSNPAIAIDGSGNLTLGVDISGSVTQSGDTISSTITFTDQYGNSDTGTVTATIFGNQSPAAGFTSASNYDSDASVSGSTAGTLIVSDTENNSPFTFTLAGTDGDKFNVAGSSSPFTIQPTGLLDAGTYSINITVTDNYSESVTLTNETIVVDAAEVLSNIYVYTLPIDGTYANVSGISADGSGTPPSPTIATTYGFFTAFVDSDTLGDSTITVAYGSNFTATRRAIVSGSNVDTALDSVGMSIGSSERAYIFIPSGSDTLSGVPTSMTISEPGTSTTAGEYVLFVSNQDAYEASGLTSDIKSANIHKLTLDTAVDGYTDWFVVGTNDRFNSGNSTLYLRLTPSSGSVPS